MQAIRLILGALATFVAVLAAHNSASVLALVRDSNAGRPHSDESLGLMVVPPRVEGTLAYWQRRYDDASASYEKIPDRHRDASLWYLLGRAQFHRGEWDASLISFEHSGAFHERHSQGAARLTAHDFEVVGFAVKLAQQHASQKNFTQAFRLADSVLQSAAASSNEMSIAHAIRSETYFAHGKPSEALTEFRLSIAFRPLESRMDSRLRMLATALFRGESEGTCADWSGEKNLEQYRVYLLADHGTKRDLDCVMANLARIQPLLPRHHWKYLNKEVGYAADKLARGQHLEFSGRVEALGIPRVWIDSEVGHYEIGGSKDWVNRVRFSGETVVMDPIQIELGLPTDIAIAEDIGDKSPALTWRKLANVVPDGGFEASYPACPSNGGCWLPSAQRGDFLGSSAAARYIVAVPLDGRCRFERDCDASAQNRVLRLDASVDGKPVGSVSRPYPIAHREKSILIVSAWVRINGGLAQIGVRWIDPSGNLVRRDALVTTSEAEAWRQFGGAYEAPDDATSVSIEYANAAPTGWVELDELVGLLIQ